MPEQTSIDIPALYHGISKQPPHVRLPGQVEASANATFSVVDGMSNRAGTRYVANATTPLGTTANLNYRTHAFERDSTEKYLLVYGRNNAGNMVLKVWHADGTLATVNLGSGVQTYLDSGSSTADDLRLTTIADYTIIVNTKVSTGYAATTPYLVTGEQRDYDVLTSTDPTLNTYWSTVNDTVVYPAGYWKYTDIYNYGNSVGAAQAAGNSVLTYYTDVAKNPGGFSVAFRRYNVTGTTATWNHTTRTLTKTGAFAAYTAVTNGEQIRITAGTGWTVTASRGAWDEAGSWYYIESKVSDDAITLVAGQAGLSATDGSTTSFDGIGVEAQVMVDLNKHAPADIYDVALAFQSALRSYSVGDLTCKNACVNWTKTTTGGKFTIVSPYDNSMYSPRAPSATGYDWTQGAAWAFAKATLNAGGTTFAATNIESRWERTIPPNQRVISPTTMPIQLVRTTYSAGGSTFDASAITWTPPYTGDTNTNPLPDFILNTKTISDVVFWQNRLWFLSDEHLSGSQNGDFFNFFINDADNITDDDPVDVAISADQVVIGEYIVPFRRTLLLFTKAGRQFEAAVANNGPVTPTSLGVTPTTNYRTLSVRPKTIGSNVHFVGAGDVSARLMEYAYDDSAAASDASDVTAHVPGLLPASVRSLSTFSNQGVSVLLGVNGYTAYLYREFYNGGRKDQSAWTTLTFSTGYRVCDLCTLDNHAYMLVESASQYVIEKFAIDPETADGGFPYVAHMDRLISLTGSYSNPTTTWTLPNSLSDATINAIVLGTAFGANSGTVLTPTTTPGTTVTKTGDYSAGAALLGRTFTTSVELSKPFRRDFNGVVKIDEYLGIRHIQLNHLNSGAYTVRASITAPPTRTDKSKVFAPPAGTLVEAAGTMSVWHNGDARKQRLFIESSSPKPFTITGLTYLADYVPRGG